MIPALPNLSFTGGKGGDSGDAESSSTIGKIGGGDIVFGNQGFPAWLIVALILGALFLWKRGK